MISLAHCLFKNGPESCTGINGSRVNRTCARLPEL